MLGNFYFLLYRMVNPLLFGTVKWCISFSYILINNFLFYLHKYLKIHHHHIPYYFTQPDWIFVSYKEKSLTKWGKDCIRKKISFIRICRKANHKLRVHIMYVYLFQKVIKHVFLRFQDSHIKSSHTCTIEGKKYFKSLDLVMVIKEQHIKNYAVWLIVHKTRKGVKIA